MEDWKIKISVLWLVFGFASIWSHMSELSLPGFIEEITAGKLGGIQITPELLLVLTILILFPPVMAFLSLTLKNSVNRWANIILGVLYTLVNLSNMIGETSWFFYMSFVVVEIALTVLMVGYAWKWRNPEG